MCTALHRHPRRKQPPARGKRRTPAEATVVHAAAQWLNELGIARSTGCGRTPPSPRADPNGMTQTLESRINYRSVKRKMLLDHSILRVPVGFMRSCIGSLDRETVWSVYSTPMALHEDEFRALIEQALRARGVSAIRAARSAGLSREAIRSVLRGRSPSFERAAEICQALDIEFYIGARGEATKSGEAPPEGERAEDAGPPAVPLTRFSSSLQLPVREWKHYSREEHASPARDAGSAPAPVGLPDAQAFYVCALTQAMIPAGIWSGDYLLISPCAKLETRQRIWLRNRNGEEAIRWLVRLPPTCYEVVGWERPDENGHQKMVAEQWMRAEVVDRGRVLAVYRGRPSVERPPFLTPDWPADGATFP